MLPFSLRIGMKRQRRYSQLERMTGEGSRRRATCNGQGEGDEMGIYTRSTSHARQGGIAYQPRGSWRRSPHSTQPLRVTPEIGGRGTGGWQLKKDEGHEMCKNLNPSSCYQPESRVR